MQLINRRAFLCCAVMETSLTKRNIGEKFVRPCTLELNHYSSLCIVYATADLSSSLTWHTFRRICDNYKTWRLHSSCIHLVAPIPDNPCAHLGKQSYLYSIHSETHRLLQPVDIHLSVLSLLLVSSIMMICSITVVVERVMIKRSSLSLK